MTDPITTFTDAELERMIERAWRAAARSAADARRRYTDPVSRSMIEAAAASDSRYWSHLVEEQERRRRSQDGYSPPVRVGGSEWFR